MGSNPQLIYLFICRAFLPVFSVFLSQTQARLKTGDTKTKYARTGFLGFLKRTELTSATGGERSVVVQSSLLTMVQAQISKLLREAAVAQKDTVS